MLAVALLLASCTAIHPPAPHLPARSSIMPGSTVKVRGNQNVYAVARENNVSMRDIIVLNDLRAPFALKAGQSLVLPAGASAPSAELSNSGYESSSVIATSPRAFNGSAGAGYNATAVEQAELPPILTQKSQPTPPQNAATGVHAMSPPSPLSSMPPSQPETHASALAQTRPFSSGKTAQAQSPTQHAMSTTGVFAPSVPAQADTTEEEEPDHTDLSLVWPVQGPILSSFGPKGQGLSNDGMNISAPKGAPVVAAASGIVVFSGNEIKGFGNLVLIRHQGGLVTAYAHLDRAMVNKDTVVAQGDMIGTVGKTGNVASPQLHFEVRKDNKPVDPAGFLKAGAFEKATQG